MWELPLARCLRCLRRLERKLRSVHSPISLCFHTCRPGGSFSTKSDAPSDRRRPRQASTPKPDAGLLMLRAFPATRPRLLVLPTIGEIRRNCGAVFGSQPDHLRKTKRIQRTTRCDRDVFFLVHGERHRRSIHGTTHLKVPQRLASSRIQCDKVAFSVASKH